MAGQQRIYRQRINSTSALQKIFRAMELIAASRIGKARTKAADSRPYVNALTQAVSAAASHIGSDIAHPLLRETENGADAAILVIAGDRGLAGAYNTQVFRAVENLRSSLEKDGKTTYLYLMGRRTIGYYQFRGIDAEQTWSGCSDNPDVSVSNDIAAALLNGFIDGKFSEVHIVYTMFKSMVTQEVQDLRLLPLAVVEDKSTVENKSNLPASGGALKTNAQPSSSAAAPAPTFPLYEFEPSAEVVLDALLPRYINTQIWGCLLEAAASELAARQRAMHTATDNANDLIRTYVRLANQARQAEITQEISEIVSGADALAGG